MAKTTYQQKWERLDRILELLKDRVLTAHELHKELKTLPDNEGLSRRVVNKYLTQLKDEGKIEPFGSQRNAKYRLIKAAMNPVDALVMHSALRMLYHHTPGNAPRYFKALNALADQLPEPARSTAKASTLNLKERKSTKNDEGRALELLAEAWFSGRVVEFEYKKHGGSGIWRKNLLEVYFIEINRSNLGLYVIGMERGFHNAVRTYKINRLRNIQITETRYTMPSQADFDPQDFLFNAWGVMGKSGGGLIEVLLRFQPEAVPWVDELNYPGISDTRYDAQSKTLELRLKVGTDNQKFPREVFSWIQGWGPRVEVLAPLSLRERWLEEARQVAALGERNVG